MDMKFFLSEHAKQEIKRRMIPLKVLKQVLDNPEQIIQEYGNKKAYQSRVKFNEGNYLLRVIVDDTKDPSVVITAYRTSKIEKYWR